MGKKLVILFCTVWVLLGFVNDDKAAALSLHVEQGDQYMIHMLNHQNTVVTVNDQDRETNQVMDMNLGMVVKEVDPENNATITYTYDSMKIHSESAGKTVDYDSTVQGEDNFLSTIYGGIIGKGFTVKINNTGKVLAIEGMNDFLDGLVSNIPDENQKKILKNFLTQSFGDNAIKSMIEQTMNYYPPENIKIGDSWTTTYDINMVFPIKVTNQWKAVSEQNGLLHVNVQSSLNTANTNGPVDFMGVKANINMNGTSQGTIDIDEASGIIAKGMLEQHISGNVELKSNKAPQKNIMLPMKINSTVTYETIKTN